ncbi:hypothetical protein CW304_26305 [Bacillus sp. UFRGS-B20]|nr:hypothetical protein CW304_26305 [Bacillus sp. UFRGS-B20]
MVLRQIIHYSSLYMGLIRKRLFSFDVSFTSFPYIFEYHTSVFTLTPPVYSNIAKYALPNHCLEVCCPTQRGHPRQVGMPSIFRHVIEVFVSVTSK